MSWLGLISSRLKLTVVLDYYEAMETYSRIGLLRSYGNLQSYWTTAKPWKLTVVLDYYEAMETYSRIGSLRSYGNLQSYWTTVLRSMLVLWQSTATLTMTVLQSWLTTLMELIWGKYTRKEWRRCENYTRNERRRCENYTRTEWRRSENHTRTEWGTLILGMFVRKLVCLQFVLNVTMWSRKTFTKVNTTVSFLKIVEVEYDRNFPWRRGSSIRL
jgi:hypothetical protein